MAYVNQEVLDRPYKPRIVVKSYNGRGLIIRFPRNGKWTEGECRTVMDFLVDNFPGYELEMQGSFGAIFPKMKGQYFTRETKHKVTCKEDY